MTTDPRTARSPVGLVDIYVDYRALQSRLGHIEARIADLEASHVPPAEAPEFPAFPFSHSFTFGSLSDVDPRVRDLVPWTPMVHNRECRAQYWRNSPWTDIASQEKIDAAIDVIGLPRTYRGPIIWDYEPYVEGHWTSDGRIVWTEEHKQKAFDAYLLLLERGRNRLPNAAHAVFGLPTILVRDPSSGTVQKPTSYWEPVLRECDFIAHQCYSGAPTFNNWQRQQLLSDLSDMRSVFPDTHICTIVHPRVAYDEEPTEMHDPIELRWRAECALDSWANSVCLWTGELRPWEPPMLEEFMAEFLKDLPGKTPTVPTIGARP